LPIGRRELRAEFLFRIAGQRYSDLMETADGIVPHGEEAGPEHEDLFVQIMVGEGNCDEQLTF
jgi:hypothetical protein